MVATTEAKPTLRRTPRIDRRDFPRRRISMHVTGRRLDHTLDARREPCLHLAIEDVSAGGLCATTQTRLNVGEHIVIYFPPEGACRGWDAYGRVLRVQPDRLGRRIGIRLDNVTAV